MVGLSKTVLLISKPCPICKLNGQIWDSNKRLAQNQKRRLSFYANILILKDPLCTENEGKVFKFRYGVKLQEKIMDQIAPQDDGMSEPVPIFDYNLGANFKLSAKNDKNVYWRKKKRRFLFMMRLRLWMLLPFLIMGKN